MAGSVRLAARTTHADTTFTDDRAGDSEPPDLGEWVVRDLEEFMKGALVTKG